jgi:hypothetical protein
VVWDLEEDEQRHLSNAIDELQTDEDFAVDNVEKPTVFETTPEKIRFQGMIDINRSIRFINRSNRSISNPAVTMTAPRTASRARQS